MSHSARTLIAPASNRAATRVTVSTMAALAMFVLATQVASPAAQQAPMTARVAGRIVLADDGATPVRRAIVKLSSGGLARSRTTISDERGDFAFDGLPAGRFMLTATRPSYAPAAYGSRAPGRPGTPLTVAAGQQLTGVVVRMARGAVITGTVRDPNGEPMPDVQVLLMRNGQAVRPMSTFAGVTARSDNTTDDRGAYRLFGIEPGTYLVVATRRLAGSAQVGVLTSAEMDAALQQLGQRGGGRGAAPSAPAGARGGASVPDANRTYGLMSMFYPGATTSLDATSITVAAGDERSGIDITLAPVPVAAIDGVITNPEGPILQLVMTIANASGIALPPALSPPPTYVAPKADGRFRYTGVTPGRYVINARANAEVGAGASAGGLGRASAAGRAPATVQGASTRWASATVTISSEDVSGVSLTLRPAMHVSGRVQFDGITPPPQDLTTVQVTVITPTARPGVPGAAAPARLALAGIPMATVSTDGTFDIPGIVPGTYQLQGLGVGSNWWLRSAVTGGVDLLDTLVQVSDEGRDVADVVLTFSDRHTQLEGTLQTPAGTPAPDYFVVVFTTDRSLWRPLARRLLSTRPATDGHFSIRDLPPGEYYLAATTDLDPSDWQSPEFLDQIAPASLTITIGEGENKRQDIRLR